MLLWLVFLPVIGGFISWLCHVFLLRIVRSSRMVSRWYQLPMIIAFMTIFITLLLSFSLWQEGITVLQQGNNWKKEVNIEWIPLLNIHFHLVLDGLSLVLITSTLFIVLLTIGYSSKESPNNFGLFYLCILFMTSAIMMLSLIHI